jgi:hypothetical protein
MSFANWAAQPASEQGGLSFPFDEILVGDPFQVCGPNWLKGSDFGPCDVVVPAPQMGEAMPSAFPSAPPAIAPLRGISQ